MFCSLFFIYLKFLTPNSNKSCFIASNYFFFGYPLLFSPFILLQYCFNISIYWPYNVINQSSSLSSYFCRNCWFSIYFHYFFICLSSPNTLCRLYFSEDFSEHLSFPNLYLFFFLLVHNPSFTGIHHCGSDYSLVDLQFSCFWHIFCFR
ncbi:unnamed protein product [Diabrotica balteata]|uniref:Uncharacterized protein n=1 Tax=Diabrotica balteata TaxID=107213 RepID=A0A9N9X9V0_DIABA|nr:unnamed protein product [Diabrotica balteata]